MEPPSPDDASHKTAGSARGFRCTATEILVADVPEGLTTPDREAFRQARPGPSPSRVAGGQNRDLHEYASQRLVPGLGEKAVVLPGRTDLHARPAHHNIPNVQTAPKLPITPGPQRPRRNPRAFNCSSTCTSRPPLDAPRPKRQTRASHRNADRRTRILVTRVSPHIHTFPLHKYFAASLKLTPSLFPWCIPQGVKIRDNCGVEEWERALIRMGVFVLSPVYAPVYIHTLMTP